MTAHTPLRRTLAAGLFDDAAMYPPAAAPMEAALALHAIAATSAWGLSQGRFLCPAGALRRLPDERVLLGLTGDLEVGAVVGSPADVHAPVDVTDLNSSLEELSHLAPDVHVGAVEYRPADPSPEALGRAADDLAPLARRHGMDQVALEVVITDADTDDVRARVEAVAAARDRHGPRISAKVRCGGATPGMIPDSAELATFVLACSRRGVPFKATAGLHHGLAVAHGPERRHGFLNLVAAALAARDGAEWADLVDLLDLDDPTQVSGTDTTLRFGSVTAEVAEVAAVRRDGFLSFGTCSFTEPLGDLLALL